jgi:hypothetical protein
MRRKLAPALLAVRDAPGLSAWTCITPGTGSFCCSRLGSMAELPRLRSPVLDVALRLPARPLGTEAPPGPTPPPVFCDPTMLKSAVPKAALRPCVHGHRWLRHGFSDGRLSTAPSARSPVLPGRIVASRRDSNPRCLRPTKSAVQHEASPLVGVARLGCTAPFWRLERLAPTGAAWCGCCWPDGAPFAPGFEATLSPILRPVRGAQTGTIAPLSLVSMELSPPLRSMDRTG